MLRSTSAATSLACIEHFRTSENMSDTLYVPLTPPTTPDSACVHESATLSISDVTGSVGSGAIAAVLHVLLPALDAAFDVVGDRLPERLDVVEQLVDGVLAVLHVRRSHLQLTTDAFGDIVAILLHVVRDRLPVD